MIITLRSRVLCNIILPSGDLVAFTLVSYIDNVEEILLKVKSYLFDILYDFIAHRFLRLIA